MVSGESVEHCPLHLFRTAIILNGMIRLQGESDCDTLEKATRWPELFAAMLASLRQGTTLTLVFV